MNNPSELYRNVPELKIISFANGNGRQFHAELPVLLHMLGVCTRALQCASTECTGGQMLVHNYIEEALGYPELRPIIPLGSCCLPAEQSHPFPL